MAFIEKGRPGEGGPILKGVRADNQDIASPAIDLNRQVAEPITISLQGTPIAKARPRLSSYRGRVRVHTPQATKTYEEQVRLVAWQAMRGRPKFSGAVEVEMRFVFAPPASWSEKKRLAAIAGEIPHVTKPDTDNCVKSWLDAMNRIVFSDDSAVTRVTAEKRYGPASLGVATVKEASNA
jgi:Holliday junction resolvase RusA-like endonuclease